MLLGHDQEPAVRPLGGDDPEALIREARRHTRRRRARLGVVSVLVAGLAAFAVLLTTSAGPGVIGETASRPFANLNAFAGEGRLAFVSRGRMWVLDGASGRLRGIPAPAGYTASLPSFSHDGRWLAYLETPGSRQVSQLWLARADGTGGHVVRGLGVDQLIGWSPTADIVAVTIGVSNRVPYSSPTGIELVSPDGDERPLVALTPAAVTRSGAIEAAVWSPNGQAIAVSLDSNSATLIRSIPLARPAAATTWLSVTSSQRLTGLCAGCRPVSEVIAHLAGWWARWGIAFWIFDGGMVHNNDSTQLAVLTGPGAHPHVIAQTLSDGMTDAVAAGAAGELAVVASSLNSGREFGEGKAVENCRAATRSCTPLPSASAWSGPDKGTCVYCSPALPAGSPGSGVSLDPAWSPSGRLLAYVKAPDARTPGGPTLGWYGDHALYVWNPRSGVNRAIGPVDGAQSPAWSRDSRMLLFVADDGLWLTHLAGGKPVEIEHPLFPESAWNGLFITSEINDYYGQIPWNAQFSWSSS